MSIIYYIEINAICIIILLLICSQVQQRRGQGSTDDGIFFWMLLASIILCISDMFSGVLRGMMFSGAYWLIEISNLMYFVMITTICYLWTLYVNIKLGKASKKKTALWSIPLLIVIVIAVSNPWTDILFSLGTDNLYVRNIGIYFHWIINWIYLLVPAFHIIRAQIRERNRSKRRDMSVLLYFIIAPIIAGLIQMRFYGVSCFQAGITISLIIVFMLGQNVQILTDALTRLNNRRGFNNYSEEVVRHNNIVLSILVIDIDDFKQINDKFSHLVGDHALRDAADVLKKVCAERTNKLFLCRYGGDEFVIVGQDRGPEYEQRLCRRIHSGFEKVNETGKNPYTLNVSIGSAYGECSEVDDVEHLLRVADEAMYEEKKRSKYLRERRKQRSDI